VVRVGTVPAVRDLSTLLKEVNNSDLILQSFGSFSPLGCCLSVSYRLGTSVRFSLIGLSRLPAFEDFHHRRKGPAWPSLDRWRRRLAGRIFGLLAHVGTGITSDAPAFRDPEDGPGQVSVRRGREPHARIQRRPPRRVPETADQASGTRSQPAMSPGSSVPLLAALPLHRDA